MKINEGESYESWCERVRMYEYGWAMQEIAQGKDVEKTLEQMSRRIIDKLMHPIFKAITNAKTPYDSEAGKQAYIDQYINKIPRASDHIDDTIT